MLKKIFSVVMAVIMALSMLTVAVFATDIGAVSELKFNANGKFRILMINDTQDVGKNGKKQLVNFVRTAIEKTKPDMIVFVGDQLSDTYIFPSVEDFKIAINNVLGICEELKIPFAVTMGNHDHDREKTLVEKDQWAELYSRYSYCVNGKAGGSFGTNFGETDYFTCNVPIKSSDGSKVALNVYMMDTNNNKGTNGNKGGYDGVNPDQVKWYEETSDRLKAENGGKVVPSLLFQHVPVKEIYGLFKECKWNTKGSIYSRRDGKWYVLDETKTVPGGQLGEAPCSEDFDTITGQYQSWLKKGDIIGAWFAHDHVNTFEGITDEGIRMGYNGGATFRCYGNGGNRSVRVFDIDENDVANYQTHLEYYKDICGDSTRFFFWDIITPKWLTWIMKVVYFLFGWVIDIFK